MQPSTISWANLVKIKSNGYSNYSTWPTINTTIQKNIASKKICLINTTVVQTGNKYASEKIVTHSSSPMNKTIDEIVDGISKVSVNENQKSREEIVAERKQRKINAKRERHKISLDQKLEKVRAPKSQKLQIIDTKFLEIYQKCNNANYIKEADVLPEGNMHMSKVTTRNRIKQRLKNKNTISINLAELIEHKKLQKSNAKLLQLEKKSIISKKTIYKRHRGKQRENQKVKQLKPLKRNILALRQLRRELCKNNLTIDDNTIKINKNEDNLNSIKYSRKFRPYCDHCTTNEINTAVELLLQDLFRFQKRAYEKNQIKGNSKRRYIVGFNEVRRNLELKKVKLLIIAPDLEPNEGEGGLDQTVQNFKLIANTNEVPYVFAISRWRIGRILFKKVPVSCVAVLNYDGVDEQYKTILGLLNIEREKFIRDAI